MYTIHMYIDINHRIQYNIILYLKIADKRKTHIHKDIDINIDK